MRLAPLWAALLAAAVQGATFVGCLYVCATGRRAGGQAPARDDPRVVRERFVRVGIACALAPGVVLLMAGGRGRWLRGVDGDCPPAAAAIRWFGLWGGNVALAADL